MNHSQRYTATTPTRNPTVNRQRPGVRRNSAIDYTRRFRALAAAIALLPASTLLLDGEVTAFDEHLLSGRAFLHPEHHVLVTPPIYIAFDCVYARERDLRDHPSGQGAKSSSV